MTDKGKMIEAVYKASLSKRATLVIFYLINRANKDLTCFPGIKTIAADCNMSDRTVRRALDDLEASGFVKKEARYRDNGGQSSNLYTLVLDIKEDSIDCESPNTVDVSSTHNHQIENDFDFNDYHNDKTESKKVNQECDLYTDMYQRMKHNKNSRFSERLLESTLIYNLIESEPKKALCQGEPVILVPP